MDKIECNDDWIDAFLQWMCMEDRTSGALPLAGGRVAKTGADAGGEFAAAYLEWMDAAQQAFESGLSRHASAFVAFPGGAGEVNELDALREAALLAALRTESECVHMLNRVLETGDASPRTVTFAFESLQHAERLLNDERNAWRVLSALRDGDTPLCGPAWRADIETGWPHAIEDVAADVHALAAKILALQPDRTGTSPR